MRTPPNNICPLMAIAGIGSFSVSATCLEERCTWWDQLAGACCIAAGADYIRDVADQLDTLNRTKNTPASTTNADEGGAEQKSDGTVSASHDTRETEGTQA